MSDRVVVWFSCGAASAVAAKLTLERYPDAILAYCDTGSEHPDNARFMADCEAWLGKPVTVLRSKKYKDTWDVFQKTRYLAGVNGARCTAELKKNVRRDFEQPDDLQIFGFDVTETQRAERFKGNNPEVSCWFPLIDAGMTKPQCFDVLAQAGIELPAMYRLGYRNNNCIGCVKGQAGYWNKIRKDFPETFQRMAKLERELNVALCKTYAGGERQRLFLDELPPDFGRYEPIECGLFCGSY